MRTYTWLAGSSPTSTTARPGVTPVCSRNAFVSSASSSRISSLSACPLMIFAIRCFPSAGSAREVDGARLADHDHLDLTRILQLFLEPARDLFAQLRHADVVHVLRVHH